MWLVENEKLRKEDPQEHAKYEYEGNDKNVKKVVDDANGDTPEDKESTRANEKIGRLMDIFDEGRDVTDWEDVTSEFFGKKMTE